MNSTIRDILYLPVFVAICLAMGGVGGAVTATSVDTWYPTLAKPSWTPPDWLFAPVWTLLYLGMAVAAWLVFRHENDKKKLAIPLGLFFIQLVLNSLWSVLFFGLQSPTAALVEMVVLWMFILTTMVVFWKRAPLAGWLFIPYWFWVSFAFILNLAIVLMN